MTHRNWFMPLVCLLSLVISGATRVNAATISVDAVLSDPDLSLADPIEFAVRFPTRFASIDLLTLDAVFVGDGLDAGEALAFAPDLAGRAVIPGEATLLSVRLTFPASLGFDLSAFLDGAFDGTIYADRNPFCVELGISCPDTTVTFDRLTFTVDGQPAPIPEPGMLTLFALAGTPLLLRRLRRRGKGDNLRDGLRSPS